MSKPIRAVLRDVNQALLKAGDHLDLVRQEIRRTPLATTTGIGINPQDVDEDLEILTALAARIVATSADLVETVGISD